ncbi:MAG TPA: hypothetical protein PKA98_11520, partial [Acidimicrobiales bacterium]|nr:hypothetical protein [Acidimicrobiales bacterium]
MAPKGCQFPDVHDAIGSQGQGPTSRPRQGPDRRHFGKPETDRTRLAGQDGRDVARDEAVDAADTRKLKFAAVRVDADDSQRNAAPAAEGPVGRLEDRGRMVVRLPTDHPFDHPNSGLRLGAAPRSVDQGENDVVAAV